MADAIASKTKKEGEGKGGRGTSDFKMIEK